MLWPIAVSGETYGRCLRTVLMSNEGKVLRKLCWIALMSVLMGGEPNDLCMYCVSCEELYAFGGRTVMF